MNHKENQTTGAVSRTSTGNTISRRAFFGFLAAGLAALSFVCIRRFDLAGTICRFFDLSPNALPLIDQDLQKLMKTDFVLFKNINLYFALSRLRAHSLLPRSTKEVALDHVTKALFAKRSISWPYIHYPDVGDFQVCNGLIRKAE